LDMNMTGLEFPTAPERNNSGPPQLIPEYEDLETGLPLTILTAVFFILSAVAHLGNATLWRSFYLSELSECRAPTRFIEYFFSAAIMVVLLAWITAVREIMLITAIAALIATTMPYGFWTEQIARPKSLDEWTLPLRSRLVPYILGHFPQVAAWAIILVSFYDEPEDNLERTPEFVYYIIWGELVFFFSFGAVQLFQQIYAPKYYVRGELAYQVLSLAAKGVLGGILLANVLLLSRIDELFDDAE
jgi:hypothetical protein